MIKFILVKGEVWVDNKTDQVTVMPRNGETFPSRGKELMIATGPNGRATLAINDDPVELRGNTHIHVQAKGRCWLARHTTRPGGGSTKLFFGRLWAMVMSSVGKEREEVGGTVGAIRG